MNMFRFTTIVYYLSFLSLLVVAFPTSPSFDDEGLDLHRRTQPFFPDSPASCPICEKNYGDIDSCAQAAPVLANFTMIIFNPGAFIDVIKCACVETFQAVFPQCVDCFIKTNQTEVLSPSDLPSVVDGMRKICALQSTLLGNVSESNGEVTPAASVPAPTPTSGARAFRHSMLSGVGVAFVVVVASVGNLAYSL